MSSRVSPGDTATALLATIGDVSPFSDGRHPVAYLGLSSRVPFNLPRDPLEDEDLRDAPLLVELPVGTDGS